MQFLSSLFVSQNKFYIHCVKNTALFFLLLPVWGAAQKAYWQQKVDVTIEVQLNDTGRTLNGFEKLVYTNQSPDTLYFIWFHLWPNAYKNDRTAFSNQRLQLGNTAFYFSSKEQRGYINQLDFKVNGITAKTEDHPEHIDIIKVLLPAPLPPGRQCTITTPFHVKLPYLFSRSGHSNGMFQITQWYPKPAVYDAQGWHPMPYLEQGEFYSEFGDYDVTITLPQEYVVAATGVLQDSAEKAWLLDRNTTVTTPEKKAAVKQYGHLKKFAPMQKKLSADNNFFKTPYTTKTLRFRQGNSHDFAWIANKNLHVAYDTCLLSGGKVVAVYTYYINKPETPWKKSVLFTKEALRFYTHEVGPYPYTTMHVVESAGTAGGMEYPAFTIIGAIASEETLDRLIAHEVGHNWFYAALANNERDAPWLDEGLNTFYEQKYTARKYGRQAPLDARFFQMLVAQRKDQPITTAAPDFTEVNYALVAYKKTARWLESIEQQVGFESFRRAMQWYYQQWRFKHPQAEAFKLALAATMPDTTAFRLLYTTGRLPNPAFAKTAVLSPLLPATIKKYVWHPGRNTWFISPAAGYNEYDKLMLGGIITNYGLPPARLQVIAIPLYATGSKKWNGIGQVAYSFYGDGRFKKVEARLSGMGFSKRFLPDSNGRMHNERFYKVAPVLRATLNAPLQSTREAWLEARTFLIREQAFSKFVTKQADGLAYVDSLATTSRYVNQFTFNVTDYRVLYPYNYQVQLQQGSSFYRINGTGNYFFNYAKGGGAGVRLFFAKFGYLTRNNTARFATAPYQPKLLGNTGEEDYTYGTYFIGRTASYAADASVVENNGLAAQQILLRDGGFKLRLDAFEFLQGRSENWVAALNLNTTLPRTLLPAFIPLKLFLDIGTYAEAKGQDAIGSRILYVGGLQLSLLRNAINIYAPVVYSAPFRDNLKTLPEQNTFLKRLTFSIDLGQLSLQRLTRNKFSF